MSMGRRMLVAGACEVGESGVKGASRANHGSTSANGVVTARDGTGGSPGEAPLRGMVAVWAVYWKGVWCKGEAMA